MADFKGNSSFKTVNDGFYEITFQENGVFLTVYPPAGNGKKVDLNDVVEKLSVKKVKGFNNSVVEAVVFNASKMPVKIAEAQEELKFDASVSVTVSPDKMKAYLFVKSPEGGRMLYTEEILELLEKQGVVYGIDMQALDTVVKYPAYNQMICIAAGKPPVNGQNGNVQFHFDINKNRKPAVLEDGRVDFRELHLIESTTKGKKLCTLIPQLPGTKGITVTGAEIPALDGKPANLPRGKNVEPTEDGQSLVSNIDGQVVYIDGKISVFSNYEVTGDVDVSTGNISFSGNVSVRGNVLSGFTIEAGGSVEVWGVVEGAAIKAGSDIILRRGMQGVGKGILISGNDIIARYIEHSSIEAKNDIKAESIMHSNVKCGNKLELSGKNGLLVGGTHKVGKEIVAKVIGSHMATVTELEVGMDPTLRDRFKVLKDEIVVAENDMKKAEQAVTLLMKLESAGALSSDKREVLAKSIRTKTFLSNRINEMREEFVRLEARLQQDSFGKIRIYNAIYPGCRVTIGTCTMYVREPLQYCTLYRDGADIRIGAIDK